MAMMISSRAPTPELAATTAFQKIRNLIDREIDQCQTLEARNGNQFPHCVTLIRKSSNTQVRLRPDSLTMTLAKPERLSTKISSLPAESKSRLETIRQLIIRKCETEQCGEYGDVIQTCEKQPLSDSQLIAHYAYESIHR